MTREDDRKPGAPRIFLAMLRRDARVARRQAVSFAIRTLLQPLLFTVVFGLLLPRMGYLEQGYLAVLFPGVVALSLTLASIQAVALPMMQDFGFTREIEDRLLAPVPTTLVALEKIVWGTAQGLVTGLAVLPLARLIMGPIPGLTFTHGMELVGVTLLGATAFSALGLWLGTAIPVQQIGMMFSIVFVPLIFFGCAYYPWQGLEAFPALQYAVLVNPLVYVTEGLRAAMVPSVPHMSWWGIVSALTLLILVLSRLGIRSFRRRAIG